MDAKKDQSKSKEVPKKAAPKAEVSTNPELGIKKVRTFAEDLEEARAKAGAPKEEPKKEKRGSLEVLQKSQKGKFLKSENSQVMHSQKLNLKLPPKNNQNNQAKTI